MQTNQQRLLPWLIGGVAAATLIGVSPAHGAGIVYADRGNVWVATPDGTVNRDLTSDGTETTGRRRALLRHLHRRCAECKLASAPARRDAAGDLESFSASWSPDGTMITWADGEGVKVAPAPDLGAAQNGEGQTCTLPAAPKVLSATGRTRPGPAGSRRWRSSSAAPSPPGRPPWPRPAPPG